MINTKIFNALNEQLNEEHFNAMLYLGLSAQANLAGYFGAQKWFYKQYQEELGHMEKISKYILDQGRAFNITKMDEVSTDEDDLQGMFTAALAAEKATTSEIAELRKLAIEEEDQSTEVFLQWFVNEQVEEESKILDILSRLKISMNTAAALLQIDSELGQR